MRIEIDKKVVYDGPIWVLVVLFFIASVASGMITEIIFQMALYISNLTVNP